MNWVTEELKYADLGDTRRNKRLVKIVEDLADQPNVSVISVISYQLSVGANRTESMGQREKAS